MTAGSAMTKRKTTSEVLLGFLSSSGAITLKPRFVTYSFLQVKNFRLTHSTIKTHTHAQTPTVRQLACSARDFLHDKVRQKNTLKQNANLVTARLSLQLSLNVRCCTSNYIILQLHAVKASLALFFVM